MKLYGMVAHTYSVDQSIRF